jgi:hypothetical protein
LDCKSNDIFLSKQINKAVFCELLGSWVAIFYVEEVNILQKLPVVVDIYGFYVILLYHLPVINYETFFVIDFCGSCQHVGLGGTKKDLYVCST